MHPLSETVRSSLLLGVLALTAYAGAWRGDFQFDDLPTILENPHFDGWRTFVGHLDHLIRPVLAATFLADRALYGESPVGYHLLNLLLHVASGWLVFAVAKRAALTESRSVPLLTALVFLVHPIQTETVTYISGRASGLMAFWYLLALFLYLKATGECKGLRQAAWFHLGASLSFLCALGAKETAVTFPAALWLWEMTVGRSRSAESRRRAFTSHPVYWLLLLGVGLWAWSHPRYRALAQFSAVLRPAVEQGLSGLHSVWYSVALVAFPWLQSFDHDLPAVASLAQWPAPVDLAVLFAFVLTIVLSVRRGDRLMTFALVWWVLQMLPAHSVVARADLLSERNLYLPVFGLFLAAAVSVTRVLARYGGDGEAGRIVAMAGRSAAVMIVCVCIVLTAQRNRLYRDPVLLWEDTVRHAPAKARPHNNLGHAYALAGRWDSAIEEFRTAVRINPDYAVAQDNLRRAYLHQVGRLQ